jgi:hypothetical protein
VIEIMIDAYYTPEHLANVMIEKAVIKSPKIIGDFAVGDGMLLNCAQKKWPRSKIVATDISKKAIQLLKKNNPSWMTGECDFLDRRSYQRCPSLKTVKGKCSLILLNPPFSCKVWENYIVSIAGVEYKCSKAMAFLINSLEYLSGQGELIAILPAGAIDASKDEDVWRYIHSDYCVTIIGTNGHNTFKGCSPKTKIVRITKGQRNCDAATDSPNSVQVYKNIKKVDIFRGRVSVCDVVTANRKNSALFIHSTHLQNKKIVGTPNKVSAKKYETIKGPAILLPRVGKPKQSKLSFYLGKENIVLSDCVIALICDSNNHAQVVYKQLFNNWTLLKDQYGGTCAPYITIEKLRKALMILNISV